MLLYSWNSNMNNMNNNRNEIELNPNTTTTIHSNLIIYKKGVYDINKTFRVSSKTGRTGGSGGSNPILIEIK